MRPLIPSFFHSFIPDQAIDYIYSWFMRNGVSIRISRSRSSKYGDYRAPHRDQSPWISVNKNLNNYDFLITIVHEMAHHEVWKLSQAAISKPSLFPFNRKRSMPVPKPHGIEWMEQFRLLMIPLLNTGIFPGDLLILLNDYFNNIRSSRRFNHDLSRLLRQYDRPDGHEFVENLPFDAVFSLPDGRSFQKKEKLRKRYRCICLSNNRIYLFSPLARVKGELRITDYELREKK